jgi:hypothetical protein
VTTRADIRDGLEDGGIWLLELTIAGRVYRIASEAVTVVDARGDTYAYTSGLDDLSVSTTDEPVASIAVSIDIGEDWALLVARGVPLVRCRCVLRRYWSGQVFESAAVVLVGLSESPQYGASDEPLTLTIIRDPNEQSGMALDALAVVDNTTWPDGHLYAGYGYASSAEGQAYPLVIGYPGYIERPPYAVAAVPALLVQYQNPPTTLTTFVVADRPIQAAQVRFLNASMGRGESRDVISVTDGLGRTVSGCDLNTPAPSSLPGAAETDEFWCGFFFGKGGIYGPDGVSALRGAGDVVEYLLRERSSIPVDYGRMSAVKERLNRYKVDTHIQAQISTWDWLTTQLFPLLPVVVCEGADGMYLRVVRWDATVSDATRYLSVERGDIEREGRVFTFREPIRNQIEIRYRGAQNGQTWYARRIVSAEAKVITSVYETQDDRVRGSYACRVSQAAHGVRPYTVDCAWTWDHATADLIAQDLASRYATPKRAVVYSGGWELEAIEPWDVVAISDAELHLDSAPALVQSRTIDARGVTLSVVILDHPVYSIRATT